jgi:CNT family concentrative nucleoside transporter
MLSIGELSLSVCWLSTLSVSLCFELVSDTTFSVSLLLELVTCSVSLEMVLPLSPAKTLPTFPCSSSVSFPLSSVSHPFFIAETSSFLVFISLVQALYYIGFIQWFIRKFATFVFWALGVSGAEAVVAAATPFIGQGESAMLVRPFVPHMTKAEIHQIMTCGFATISGSVLVGYIGLGLNAEVLVSSCIMSIPASLAISKLRYPETEEALTAGSVTVPVDKEDKAENILHAFANGAMLGIKIALSIIASLLCIIALVGLINGLMTWWGRYLNINGPLLTLQTIFGYLFYPVAFLLGVSREGNDLLLVARLIAEKIITVSTVS